MAKMGLQMGLETGDYCKRQNHWMFIVDDIVGDVSKIQSLPPSKSARPNLTFKENAVKHLIEDVFYPGKPDWKPVQFTIFDLKRETHPIFDWIKELYNPKDGEFNPPNETKGPKVGFIRECRLELYDGCGNTIEKWIFEDCWPQAVNFQTLDMAAGDIMMCDITLRFARAYVEEDEA